MSRSQADLSRIIKTNKWNQIRVKTSIDDAIRAVVIDRIGLKESYKFLDVRLYICITACIVAAIATAYDYLNPFPASKTVLIVCCLLYFISVGVLTWFMTYVEKQIFLNAVGKDVAGINPDNYWEFSSNMDKYDKDYKLTIVKRRHGNSSCNFEHSLTRSVEDWIDDDGLVLMDEIESVIRKCINEFLISSKKE